MKKFISYATQATKLQQYLGGFPVRVNFRHASALSTWSTGSQKLNPTLRRKYVYDRNVVFQGVPTLGENAQLMHRHAFHTSGQQWQSEGPDVKSIVISIPNPLKWFGLKLKMLLLRRFFDGEFNPDEFVQGAKQALIVLSSRISEGKFAELDELASSEAVREGRQLYEKYAGRLWELKVESDDIANLSITDIGFEYGEDGRKWAHILVVCLCTAKEAMTKKFGNVEFVSVPFTRVLKYSFTREYTPGTSSGWLVDSLDHTKLSPSS